MLSKKPSSRGEAKPTLSSPRPILYFRQSPNMGTLVFAPPKRAELIDQLHRAIEVCRESGCKGEMTLLPERGRASPRTGEWRGP